MRNQPLRQTLCADCTAKYAVVTVHRSGNCDHNHNTAFLPLRRADTFVPAESLERSPRVSEVELSQLFVEGRDLYLQLTRRDRWKTTVPLVIHAVHNAVTVPWGGVTLSADGVENFDTGYAVSIRPKVFLPVSVPIGDTAGLTDALDKFSTSAPYIGVFRDELKHAVEIDHVAVVENRRHADALGVYCGSTGGACNLADGLGYWAPVL